MVQGWYGGGLERWLTMVRATALSICPGSSLSGAIFGNRPFSNGGDATKQMRGIADGFGWGRRSDICNNIWGGNIGIICRRNQWHNRFRGVRRLRLSTLFFDLAVVAQQTTCVSAMPRDHFGCASWRDKNATKICLSFLVHHRF